MELTRSEPFASQFMVVPSLVKERIWHQVREGLRYRSNRTIRRLSRDKKEMRVYVYFRLDTLLFTTDIQCITD